MPYSLSRILAIVCVIATLACNAATAGVAIPDPVVDIVLGKVAQTDLGLVEPGRVFWRVVKLNVSAF